MRYLILFFFILFLAKESTCQSDNKNNLLYKKLSEIEDTYSRYFAQYPRDTNLRNYLILKCDTIINADTFLFRAYSLHYKGLLHMNFKNKIARECFESSIKINPEIFENYDKISVLDEWYYGYGLAPKQRAKIWQRAQENYKLLTQKDSLNAIYWFYFGKSLYNEGVYLKKPEIQKSGLVYIRKATILDSTNSGFWYALGSNSTNLDSIIFYLSKAITHSSGPRKEFFSKLLYTEFLLASKDFNRLELMVNKWIEQNPGNPFYTELKTDLENRKKKKSAK